MNDGSKKNTTKETEIRKQQQKNKNKTPATISTEEEAGRKKEIRNFQEKYNSIAGVLEYIFEFEFFFYFLKLLLLLLHKTDCYLNFVSHPPLCMERHPIAPVHLDAHSILILQFQASFQFCFVCVCVCMSFSYTHTHTLSLIR